MTEQEQALEEFLSRYTFDTRSIHIDWRNDRVRKAASWCRRNIGDEGKGWQRHMSTFMFTSDRDRAMFKLLWWEPGK